MCARIILAWVAVACLVTACPVLADDFYALPLGKLHITEGALPEGAPSEIAHWDPSWYAWQHQLPYAIGKHGEEIYFGTPRAGAPQPATVAEMEIVLRAPAGAKPSGTAFFPLNDGKTVRVVFDLGDVQPGGDDAHKRFFETKLAHYNALLRLNTSGGAWFRHEAQEAQQALGEKAVEAPTPRPTPWSPDNLAETYSLFSGGRAMSENLQLDRELRVVEAGERNVTVADIEGITTKEIDWTPLIKDKTPRKDALAKLVPFDQYALYFPSFQSMIDLMDNATEHGTPVLHLMESRSEDAHTKQRYERQLLLSTDAMSRLLGPKVIHSVAFTGSDPYLRTGTDVAVIFEAADITALRTLLAGRRSAQISGLPQTQPVQGKVGEVAYEGIVTPDRSVCSYIATVGQAVVVTNSLTQLERIVQSASGAARNMADLPEYTFFRDRYAYGDAEETALLVITDAAIRRWCSPQWRIGASRRTRAAAAMMELQARRLPALAAGQPPAPIADAPAGLGEVTLSGNGPRSSLYNTLDFLTPIVEMDVSKATQVEVDAYRTFRDRYQWSWRQYFDPIAIRLTVKPGTIAADVTVRPLTEGSDYREFMRFCGQARLTPQSGDRHPEALLQLVTSIDRQSRQMQSFEGFLRDGVSGAGLSWLGNWGTLYFDKSPIWDELARKITASENDERSWKWIEQNLSRFPVGLAVSVSNRLTLAATLTALRTKIEQTAPGMVKWENPTHAGITYVKISPTDQQDDLPKGFCLYYATLPTQFLVSVNEDVIKRAIDRSATATAPVAADPPAAAKVERP